MSTQQNEQRANVQMELMADIGVQAQCIEDFSREIKSHMALMLLKGTIALSEPAGRAALQNDEASRLLTDSAGELAELAAMVTELHGRLHEYIDVRGGGEHT